MSSRPLFWLTVFFMLGISANRLFGEGLPVQTHWFVLAALILIAAMVISLFSRNRFANWFRLPSSVLRSFAIPALLFAVFGMWSSRIAAPQFPQALEQYLNGQPATFIAEVTGSPEYIRQQAIPKIVGEVPASPEYYPESIRIPLRLLWAITGGRQTPLDGGVLLSVPRKDPANPGVFFLPPASFQRNFHITKPFRRNRRSG